MYSFRVLKILRPIAITPYRYSTIKNRRGQVPACKGFVKEENQSRISISLPQQKGTTSPDFTWTVLLQVTQ